MSGGPDSNIDRSDQLAICRHDHRAVRAVPRHAPPIGIGLAIGGQAFIRNDIGGLDLVSRAGVSADLFTKPRFNDIQVTLDSGPELAIGRSKARAAALYERRWFGGDQYSTGVGGQLELLAPLGSKTQLGLGGSHVRQTIARNSGQDGWRTALNADLTRLLGSGTVARSSVRYAALDARVNPQSLRQAGAGLLVARQWRTLTLFGEVDYTRTHGIEPMFLLEQLAAMSAGTWSAAPSSTAQASADLPLAAGAGYAQRQQRQYRTVRLPAHPPRLRPDTQLLTGAFSCREGAAGHSSHDVHRVYASAISAVAALTRL